MKLAHLLRSVALCGLTLGAVTATTAPAAADAVGQCSESDGTSHRQCTLPLNKSLIIDLPRDARDILVSNPSIADAVVRTARRIYLTGVAVGETNIFVFDGAGDVIVSMELAVERDISGLEGTLERLIIGSAIAVEIINDNIILSGTVKSAADARRAQEIALIFANGGANATAAGGGAQSASSAALNISLSGSGATGEANLSQVINLLSIEGEDQVHLTVTVAEIERDTVKQLGLSWGLENVNVGNGMVFSAAAANLFPAARGAAGAFVQNIEVPNYGEESGTLLARSAISANLQALESHGLVHTLAEPTLTAISGETASFLAGGEFPVGTSRAADGSLGIEYKPFGVSLSFTPVVLSEGRISLHIATEVSSIANVDPVTELPVFSVRRAESTLELPSGGAMVMSGLLQDNVRQVSEGLPGLRQIPVLGALFGSRDYQREETELVIIVTPYLVQPVARSALGQPTDGFAVPSDAAATFLGQLNRQYGVQSTQPTLRGSYQGNFGFIIE